MENASARKGAASEGINVHALLRVLDSCDVAQQHFRIGQQVMPEGNGLCALEMGVSRHDGLSVFLRLVADHTDQLPEIGENIVRPLAEMQTNVERYLIVAAAGGVQALAGAAQTGCQLAFHEGVNVLCFHINRKRATFDVG